MATIGSLFVSIGVGTDNLKKGLKKAEGMIGRFGHGLGALGAGAAAGALGATAAGITAVGAAAAATGVAAFDLATDIDQATRNIQGSLGVTAEEAEALGDVATEVFANNFGASVQEAAAVVADLAKQMPELTADELQTAAENAFRLTDAFDQDLNQVVDSADTLMDQFGLTSDQAFDFLASGFQKGLDSSGDFLDSVGEYSNQFAEAGLRADHFFSLLEGGVQGGVLGTDKIADAFKEFNVRMLEASTDTRQALDSIGIDSEALFNRIQSGEVTVGQSFQTIIRRINEIEDPLERARVQTELFGTMAEDLGPSFTEGLNVGQTALEEMSGSTEALNEQYNSLGQVASEVWRELLVALQPAAEELLLLAQEAMPFVKEVFEAVQPVIEQFATTFGETIGPALTIIVDSLNRMAQALGITSEEFTGIDLIVATVAVTLDLIITAIEATAVAFHLAAGAVEIVADWIRQLNQFIERGVSGWWDASAALWDIVNAAAQLASSGISNLVGGAISGVGNLLGFADGGVVPGPMGAPRLAVVHGGETITPAGQSPGNVININGVNVSSGGGDLDAALAEAFGELRRQIMAQAA